MRPAVFLILGAGCVNISDEQLAWRSGSAAGGTDTGCESQTWWTDADGDGYGDPTGAVQACEQPAGTVDNYDDCDDTDPDAALVRDFYLDSDGDGWGVDTVTQACSTPDGYADQTGDCDDANDQAHPGQTETCATSFDDDCNGDANEIDALDCSTWYIDADGDGWGDLEVGCACEAFADGQVDQGGDCDDDDPAVNPDQEEICFDGVDNDCDGGAGDCPISDSMSLSDIQGRLLGDQSDDGVGKALDFAGDIDGDGHQDLVIGAPGGDLTARQAGQAYVVLGPVSGQLSLAGSGGVYPLRGGGSNDYAGWSVAGAGDLDQDGYDDLLVGAIYEGASNNGAAYVVHGPISGGAQLEAAGVRYSGVSANDFLGSATAPGGSVGGAGTHGAWLAAYHESTAGNVAGAVYLVDGTGGGTVGGQATATVYGASGGDRLGYSVAGAEDLDGDGVDDVVVGADRNDDGGSNAGAAYVLLGPIVGDVSASDADAVWIGTTGDAGAGGAVAIAGDLDGDGSLDVVVGAPGASAGVAYVLFDPAQGGGSLSSAGAQLLGDQLDDGAGRAVSAAGDFDGDGSDDVLIGAYDASSGGIAYLVRGPVGGSVDLATSAVALSGASSGDQAGYAVAGGEDINADGAVDVLVGAPGADGDENSSGVAYMVFGGGL